MVSIAGVDEVGRGPLVGNVVTCAVVLDPQHHICGITDSKKLTPARREQLFDDITQNACAFHFGWATPDEIDCLNIHHATLLAMKRAIEGLSVQPTSVLIDGKFVPEGLSMPAQAVIKGDLEHECIGAASILAKVVRDRQMLELSKAYPEYGFEQHKGYPTKQHLMALEKHGVCPQHRRSFKPVAALLD